MYNIGAGIQHFKAVGRTMIIRGERYDTYTRAFCHFELRSCHFKQDRQLGRALSGSNSSTCHSPTRTDFSQETGVLAYPATTVSYTHLRAHETRHDLVCRLLLEKKK